MQYLITYYLRRNWIIYGLFCLYVMGVVLNAVGVNIWLPSCLITEFTGYSCYGCGLTTAAIHLIQGNLGSAYMANPLVFLYIPAIVYWIVSDYYKFTVHLKTTKA